MLRSWISRISVFAVFALILALPVTSAASPAVAASGGNSAALSCRDRGFVVGWIITVRADGTPFKNTGSCVSWITRGGATDVAPSPQVCEGFGGTFVAGSGNVLWTCFGVLPLVLPTLDDENLRDVTFVIACSRDNAGLGASLSGPPNIVCFRV
jgi:hypothetical protein